MHKESKSPGDDAYATPLLKGLDVEVGSNATVLLSEDEVSVNTGSPRPSPTQLAHFWLRILPTGSGVYSNPYHELHHLGGLCHSIKDAILAVIDQEAMKDEIK